MSWNRRYLAMEEQECGLFKYGKESNNFRKLRCGEQNTLCFSGPLWNWMAETTSVNKGDSSPQGSLC